MRIKKRNLKITILIANYNNARFLSKCINSVLAQNYDNKEVIVIDDNSSDDSNKILNRFKNKIKILKNKKKKGLGFINQMNVYYQGYLNANGDIICLLDSDDFFKRDKILNISKFFSNFPEKNFYFDLPVIIDNKGNKYKKKKTFFLKNYWSNLPPTSCISLRKKCFKKVFMSIYANRFSDIWMDFRMGICSKYLFKDFNLVDKHLTFYRKTQGNVSSKFKHLSLNWWKRRMQAHYYVLYFFKKNDLIFRKNLDFRLTSIINFFIS